MNSRDRQRYSRQIALPQIGEAGQERLLASSVLILGAGGLGSPAAYYLTAAGIGRIGLLDFDEVDSSNLQRQILHTEKDVGRLKTDSAAEKLLNLNSSLRLELHRERFDESNAERLCSSYDFILDATDHFGSKLLAAESAWRTGKGFSFGGINAFVGQTMTVLAGKSPCLRCLLKRVPPQNDPPTGPFGAVAGVIGCMQASEAIKVLAGLAPSLTGHLLYFDALSMSCRKIAIKANPQCPVCGGTAGQTQSFHL